MAVGWRWGRVPGFKPQHGQLATAWLWEGIVTPLRPTFTYSNGDERLGDLGTSAGGVC